MKFICLAAILRDEEPFLDEWLVYHKMIGINHFFLYDDAPDLPLKKLLQPHAAYVTVIPWYHMHEERPGINRQTKAYTHALQEYGSGFEWITFIDGDEFIVLRKHDTINEFLLDFPEAVSITLHWHVFGHNNFYDDPPGLITASLIRRKGKPSENVKSITRPGAIASIENAHVCVLKYSSRVDTNNKVLEDLYEGISEVAHINHYQCRSFKRWMRRANRGEVTFDNMESFPQKERWRLDEEQCLKQFVVAMASDKNEKIDTYMQKYSAAILYKLMKMGIKK
ncbi:hypothetical protein A4D02_34825 [Niastella koreensis]|uniref:Glycosyl transferase family 2 n=2 Tax=Niastella koreensis TaxID=354356 RepID=G8TKI5_NIAKG|nr:glycosyltransferase family 92 protein [Niastella koreensis]AEV98659.1 protein of unknown function DUF23 [Niastella koreensis GR20-10]OQP44400.1 hypothetical protein A4D02_34825 [Niastella koreensis]